MSLYCYCRRLYRMLSQYYTVNLEGSEQMIVQKSRFIGYVRRVETEQEALDFIQEIKKQHHDATHNCSAYIIGEHDHIQKANDDGEPSGTAGVPMLEVLKKQSLKDRKSTRLNSSHVSISYAVFCLKKK